MRVTVPFVEVYYRISGERASAAPVKMYVDRRLRTVRLDRVDEKNGAERWIHASHTSLFHLIAGHGPQSRLKTQKLQPSGHWIFWEGTT